MDKILITVIVPVYNVEKYVLKCLQSIQNQTFQNFEAIIVDDGSTDGSGAICDQFVQTDSRFVVIHQANQGLSAARNTGLDAAKGEFLMFVDSDDFIHPQMMEILYQCCVEHNAEIAICKYSYIEEGEKADIQPIDRTAYHATVVSGRESCARIYTETVCETVISWNKLYRRDSFETMRFPVGKIHEDEFVTYQILYEAERVAYVEAVLYYYLQRSGSIMLQPQYGSEHMVLLEMAKESIRFYLSKDDEKLAAAALERAYAMHKGLYKKYRKTGRGDLQKIVLECYRALFQEFRGLTPMSRYQEFTVWLYGYWPAASQGLTSLFHQLWLLKHHKIWNHSLVRFGIVGVLNTVIGTGVMFFSYNVLGFGYWISSALNYIVGSVFSFFANKYFTFAKKEKSGKEIFRFIGNICVCYFLAYGIAKPLTLFVMEKILPGLSAQIFEQIAMVVGMGLFVCFNYIGQKKFVFKGLD
jgi:glycosyltransferase involved in cell wall biosynthesis